MHCLQHYAAQVIARRYLQGWFTVDVLSCLPINYVEYIWSTNDLGINPKLLKVVRLLRLSRLLKLTKFVKILEMYEDTSVRDWLDRMRMLFFVVCILWYTHLLVRQQGLQKYHGAPVTRFMPRTHKMLQPLKCTHYRKLFPVD